MSRFTVLNESLHDYMVAHGARQDEVLARVQRETAELGSLASMQIAPDQGAFMTLLVRAIGAREALEVGTFTGYSAICTARGLPEDGRLICCELNPEYAAIAQRNLEDAGVADRVEIRVGPALESLRAMPAEERFDFVFIDADKKGYPGYWEEAIVRTRPNGLILLDNVLASGRVSTPTEDLPADTREQVAALRRTAEIVTADERVDTAMVAIADGLLFARKR